MEKKYFVVVSESPWKKNSGFIRTSEVFEEEHDYIWDEDDLKECMVQNYYTDWKEVGDGIQITAEYYEMPFDPMTSEPVKTVECWVYPEDFDLDVSDMSNDDLAQYVYQADKWDLPGVEDCMKELCNRAGMMVRDMEDSEQKQEFIDLMEGLDREHWDPILDYTAEDVIWRFRNAEVNADWVDIAHVIQNVLNVDLGC